MLRSVTTEPDHGGLDVDDLIKTLQACLDTSSESGGCWLQQATRKTKKDMCEAKGIVEEFTKLVDEAKATCCYQTLSRQRCLSLCIWLAYISAPQPVALTEFQAFVKPKESYKPQGDIRCPDTPYFIQDAMDPFATPRLTAPRLCPLWTDMLSANMAAWQRCAKGFFGRLSKWRSCRFPCRGSEICWPIWIRRFGAAAQGALESLSHVEMCPASSAPAKDGSIQDFQFIFGRLCQAKH